MNRMILPVLALALVALPALAEAQGRGAGFGGMMGQQNPVERILMSADSLELGLTEAEVTQLTTIRDELTDTNAPHLTAIQGLIQRLQGGDTGAMQELQTHMQPVQAANQAALARVRELLSAEQMTKVDAMLAAGRGGRGGRGAGGGGGGPG